MRYFTIDSMQQQMIQTVNNRVMKMVGSPKNREAGLITKCNQIMFSEFSLREQKSSPVFWTGGACLEPI